MDCLKLEDIGNCLRERAATLSTSEKRKSIKNKSYLFIERIIIKKMSASSDKPTVDGCTFCFKPVRHRNKSSFDFKSSHDDSCVLARYCTECGVRIDRSSSIHESNCTLKEKCCSNSDKFNHHDPDCVIYTMIATEMMNSCDICGTTNPMSHHQHCKNKGYNNRSSKESKKLKEKIYELIPDITTYEEDLGGYNIHFRLHSLHGVEVYISSDRNNIIIMYRPRLCDNISTVIKRRGEYTYLNIKIVRDWFENYFSEIYYQNPLIWYEKDVEFVKTLIPEHVQKQYEVSISEDNVVLLIARKNKYMFSAQKEVFEDTIKLFLTLYQNHGTSSKVFILGEGDSVHYKIRTFLEQVNWMKLN